MSCCPGKDRNTGSRLGAGAPAGRPWRGMNPPFKAHKGPMWVGSLSSDPPSASLKEGTVHFVSQDSSGQEETAFAKLRAKNNSAHPTTACELARQHLKPPERQARHGAPGDHRPRPQGPGQRG